MREIDDIKITPRLVRMMASNAFTKALAECQKRRRSGQDARVFLHRNTFLVGPPVVAANTPK